jgi:hypothetical protein
MQSWIGSSLGGLNSREFWNSRMKLLQTRGVGYWGWKGKVTQLSINKIPSHLVSSRSQAHPNRTANLFPSLPFGIEIVATTHHSPMPQTCWGNTVSLLCPVTIVFFGIYLGGRFQCQRTGMRGYRPRIQRACHSFNPLCCRCGANQTFIYNSTATPASS